MLGLDRWQKKKQVMAAACADGEVIPLDEVNDPVFSLKMMGDGFGLIPQSDTICAGCTGRLTMIFDTPHAFELRWIMARKSFII